VNRIALLAIVSLAALASALPALADRGGPIRGTVTVLSATSVSVKDAHRTVTCAVKTHSPSLTGYAVGDRVQAQCRGRARNLVLARIRHLSAPAAGTAPDQAGPVKFGGAITALSADSISLHDGVRDLTCAINDASPSTSDLAVGDHARVVCQDGALVSVLPITAHEPGPPKPPLPPPTAPPAPVPPDGPGVAGTNAAGTLAAP
jgi:hypothetical protein